MAITTIHRRWRTKRFNLRATARQEKLIRTVAKQQGLNVTEFILESACKEAEQTLVDQQQFNLSATQWQAFTKTLDRPVKSRPKLRRLLSEPSILEKPA